MTDPDVRIGRMEEWRRKSFSLSSADRIYGVVQKAVDTLLVLVKKDGDVEELELAVSSLTSDRTLTNKWDKQRELPLREAVYGICECLEVTLRSTIIRMKGNGPDANTANIMGWRLKAFFMSSTDRIGCLIQKIFDALLVLVQKPKDLEELEYAFDALAADRLRIRFHDKEREDPLRAVVYGLSESLESALSCIKENLKVSKEENEPALPCQEVEEAKTQEIATEESEDMPGLADESQHNNDSVALEGTSDGSEDRVTSALSQASSESQRHSSLLMSHVQDNIDSKSQVFEDPKTNVNIGMHIFPLFNNDLNKSIKIELNQTDDEESAMMPRPPDSPFFLDPIQEPVVDEVSDIQLNATGRTDGMIPIQDVNISLRLPVYPRDDGASSSTPSVAIDLPIDALESDDVPRSQFTRRSSVGMIPIQDVQEGTPDGLKPDLSHAELIKLAFNSSATGQLTTADINDFICLNFPYYRTANAKWKTAVRDCLRHNKLFDKIDINMDNRKRCLWYINTDIVEKANLSRISNANSSAFITPNRPAIASTKKVIETPVMDTERSIMSILADAMGSTSSDPLEGEGQNSNWNNNIQMIPTTLSEALSPSNPKENIPNTRPAELPRKKRTLAEFLNDTVGQDVPAKAPRRNSRVSSFSNTPSRLVPSTSFNDDPITID